MNSIKHVFKLLVIGFFCFFILISIAKADAYFGFSLFKSDYSQPSVISATLADDDPCCTGLGAEITNALGQTFPGTLYVIAAEDGLPRPSRVSDIDEKLDMLKFKLGFELFEAKDSSIPALSVEIRGGFGTNESILVDYSEEIDESYYLDNSVTPPQAYQYVITTPTDSELRTEYYYGFFLRLGGSPKQLKKISFYPDLAIEFSPYILLGHSRVNFSVTDISGTAGGKIRGESWGLGLNVKTPFENMFLNIEYLDLMDKNGIESAGYSAGFEYRF